MNTTADWITPDWPAPPGVRALCTTRAGGVSRGAYASLNLGDHVGDEPRAVAHNRGVLSAAIGLPPLFVRQVHGSASLRLTRESRPDSIRPAADATWTSDAGVVCAMLVADCLPVLFVAADGSRIAAAHAGWRGLAGGVLEETLQSIDAPAHTEQAPSATQIIAWLGPCIGPDAFEVGDQVRDAFVHHSAIAADCFRPAPAGPAAERKWWADLPALARQRLQAAGVSRIYGNDGSAHWCTVAQPSRFFSHRRDAGPLGGSGRFAACIWCEA